MLVRGSKIVRVKRKEWETNVQSSIYCDFPRPQGHRSTMEVAVVEQDRRDEEKYGDG